MTEHELTVEKIAELHNVASKNLYPLGPWNVLSRTHKERQTSFARDAYDLGKQAAATVSGAGWTDDELGAAVHEAAENARGRVLSINQDADYPLNVHSDLVADLRHLLTALGIDHQPKPELPDTPGSVIYDVVDDEGDTYKVMALDRDGWWRGVDQDGCPTGLLPRSVTSWRPLDLDKVRGEQNA